jgi:RNA polymerase primary sigma factor
MGDVARQALAVANRKSARTRKRSKPRTVGSPLHPGPGEEVEYVYHPTFSLPQTEKRLWGDGRDQIDVSPYGLLPAVDDGKAAPSRSRNNLKADEEKLLFQRYNYAKYRLAKLINDEPESPELSDDPDVQLWRRRAAGSREKLVHANLPLVPNMARKVNIIGVEFAELVSEGYMAVLRCVEKFDCSRGFKFSTYACRSILSAFYRRSSKAQTRRKHIPAHFEQEMEKSDFGEQRHESQRSYASETVRKVLSENLADLSDIERRVIQERHPLVAGTRPRTLAQVGRSVGLSNERVRQIEKASLAKIRQAVEARLGG